MGAPVVAVAAALVLGSRSSPLAAAVLCGTENQCVEGEFEPCRYALFEARTIEEKAGRRLHVVPVRLEHGGQS